VPLSQGEYEAPPGEASALLAALRRLADPELCDHASHSQVALTLPQAYRACVAITRQHSRSFFLSSQLLPRAKRDAIRALYAFCRTSDDLVDNPTQDATQALAAWVTHVHAPAAPAGNAVLLAWNDTVARHRVPAHLPDELLAGIAMDLSIARYATFDELWLYCYRVASVVGLISMHIIGYAEGAAAYAIKLGVALQLTNILRDVGEDAARGRIYLPQEDLAHFGLTDDDILRGVRDERWRALMQFEIERAHQLYDEAWPGIALLNPDGRLAIAAAAEIYRGILAKIVACDYDVFGQRVYVPLREKLLMLWRVRRRLARAERRQLAAGSEPADCL
jgi:phytoene synthase